MVEVAVEVLRRVRATRYIEPLREGGSLPGLVEADDLGTYVVKFTGAGQGPKALVSEVIVGELGRRLGIRIPELVLVEMDPAIGRREADAEVQQLLLASPGTNLGIDFLPGSIGYDGISWRPAREVAARVLWLDALTVNVDRSWRNPNLLVWHGALWAIDHGAALLFQHTWPGTGEFAARRYPLVDHALSTFARSVSAIADELAALTTDALLEEVVAMVPAEWLPATDRAAYVEYLSTRARAGDRWLPEVGR
ncbi:MAG TPA: HipA family kinase [Jiangellaceae bacterium]|jgi:hypothetical protein|nr:HipA family kinase [Jiangellaceae bacterium]